MSRRFIFLLVVLSLHIPLFAYPILRLCYWLGIGVWLTGLIFLPLFFSQIVARVYLSRANSGWVFWLRRAADLWLGISPLLLCMLLLTEIPVVLAWILPVHAALIIVVFIAALTLFSVVNAYSPAVVRVPIRSSKVTSAVRIAQITDVHIGSRSGSFLARVIDKVNSAKPDFLCITGDFIDARGIKEEQLKALRRLSVPVYFSIGNHERYEDLEQILQRLGRLGVTVLRTQSAREGEVQCIGIDDSEKPLQVAHELEKVKVDDASFVLLLYHRPRGLKAAAAAGVDLMISGHTHNGQIIPFNLVVKRVFKRTVGRFELNGTTLYVSPGTGTWGPVMRLGSKGEVTVFEVQPITE